jgi:hypothetical protein
MYEVFHAFFIQNLKFNLRDEMDGKIWYMDLRYQIYLYLENPSYHFEEA